MLLCLVFFCFVFLCLSCVVLLHVATLCAPQFTNFQVLLVGALTAVWAANSLISKHFWTVHLLLINLFLSTFVMQKCNNKKMSKDEYILDA